MWCGVVWCGVVWCGVVWCGVVWCGVFLARRSLEDAGGKSHRAGRKGGPKPVERVVQKPPLGRVSIPLARPARVAATGRAIPVRRASRQVPAGRQALARRHQLQRWRVVAYH